jgi:DNA-binding SARP family transcriptional activator
VDFSILGPLEVVRDGRPVPIGGARERALLSLLLLRANEAVTPDRLIDELWGDPPPPTARKSLQVRVAGLRRALGADVLVSRGGAYAIHVDTTQLDLRRFEQLLSGGARALADGNPRSAVSELREALALWRGPALAEFAYESFAQPAIARLEELRLTALELRIDADLALARHAHVVGELKDLVAAHPLRERLQGQLMLALYRDGRQAEALDVYRQARDMLVAELGLEPSPALRQLEQSMLRQEPSLDLAVMPPERSILVASQGIDRLGELIAFAETLGRRPARELLLARLVRDSVDVPATAALLNERRDALLARGVAARAITFTSRAAGEDLIRVALEQDVDLVLVDAKRLPDLQPVVETLLRRAPCDVAVLLGHESESRTGPVLVLFAGGDHDWSAVELGAWIAAAREVPLRLAGPAEGPERDASRVLASVSLAVQRGLGIAAEPVLLAPTEEAVLAAAADVGTVVIGLPERWHRNGLGIVRSAVVTRAQPPVLLVRRGIRPGGLAPREDLTRFTWTLAPPLVDAPDTS